MSAFGLRLEAGGGPWTVDGGSGVSGVAVVSSCEDEAARRMASGICKSIEDYRPVPWVTPPACGQAAEGRKEINRMGPNRSRSRYSEVLIKNPNTAQYGPRHSSRGGVPAAARSARYGPREQRGMRAKTLGYNLVKIGVGW